MHNIFCRFSAPLQVLNADARSFLGFGHHLGLTFSHAGIDPMPDKMNLDYCEFQNYEFMTMSVVGGQPKKHTSQ